ncbi:MAG: valine--tRNA ligase, partial [Gammaproteobacteria bacterium]|nr:valine--tRNA ligase [Gammaproteobacteria bacterium]
IMRRGYPVGDASLVDDAVIAELEWVKSFIMGVRQVRSEMDIKPGRPLPVLCQHGAKLDRQRIDDNRALLVALAKLESITWLEAEAAAPDAATSLVGEMQLLIPLAGLIDKQAELARLQKNIQKLQQDAERINAKLGNENFIARAPEAVVHREQEKLAETESALNSLRMQAERIASI